MFAIAALFIGFASLMTLGVPTSQILLRRSENGVSARIEQRVLWWIPFRRQTLERLDSVATTIYQGPAAETPRTRDGETQSERMVTPEAEGTLWLVHVGGKTRLSVSPQNLDALERRIGDFLRGGPPELTVLAVANWKFGVIVPGILAAFGGLILALFLGESLWLLIRGQSHRA